MLTQFLVNIFATFRRTSSQFQISLTIHLYQHSKLNFATNSVD